VAGQLLSSLLTIQPAISEILHQTDRQIDRVSGSASLHGNDLLSLQIPPLHKGVNTVTVYI